MRWLARRRTAALWRAIQASDAGALVKLLGQGADVDARDADDVTPLHVAARWGHAELAKLLLERGGDVDAEERFGGTPLSLAEQFGYTEVAALLRQHEAEE